MHFVETFLIEELSLYYYILYNRQFWQINSQNLRNISQFQLIISQTRNNISQTPRNWISPRNSTACLALYGMIGCVNLL